VKVRSPVYLLALLSVVAYSCAPAAKPANQDSTPTMPPSTMMTSFPKEPSIPASDVPDLTAAVRRLLDALAASDEATVADATLLPVSVPQEQRLFYSRRLILASRLQWLLSEKFGARRTRTILWPAELDYVAWYDPEQLSWRSLGSRGPVAEAGATEIMIGHEDGESDSVLMARTCTSISSNFAIPDWYAVNSFVQPPVNAAGKKARTTTFLPR